MNPKFTRRALLAGAGLIGASALAGCSAATGVREISIFAASLPESTPTGAGVHAMVDYINSQNAGLEAMAFFDTSLGDASTLVQALQEGTIDVGVAGNAYFSGLVPEIQAFELPFLFESWESARKATGDPAVREYIFAKFEADRLIGLSFWENGLRQLSNNVRPVVSPSDLKGIKIRTLPAPIQQQAWAAMGALPQAIDSSELYTALQQGTVSAQENPLAEIVFRRFYEVQPFISITSHVYTPFTMAAAPRTYNALTPEQQKVLRDAAEVGRNAQFEASTKADLEAKQILLDNGVKIEESPNIDAFRELGQSVWPTFIDEHGEDFLNLVRAGAAK